MRMGCNNLSRFVVLYQSVGELMHVEMKNNRIVGRSTNAIESMHASDLTKSMRMSLREQLQLSVRRTAR